MSEEALSQLVDYIEGRLIHASRRATQYRNEYEESGIDPTKRWNYYGGRTCGYWCGMEAALEDLKGFIEEMKVHSRTGCVTETFFQQKEKTNG